MEKCKQNESQSDARGMATTGEETPNAHSYPAYIGLDVHKDTNFGLVGGCGTQRCGASR